MSYLEDEELKLRPARFGSSQSGKNYAILRVSKIKTKGSVMAAAKHNNREIDTPNADDEKKNIVINTSEEVQENFDATVKRLDKPLRKNGVVALEYFISYSPGAKIDENEYFLKAINFVKKKHGNENLLQVAIHRDETTPHLHILAMPVVKKKDKRTGKKLTGLSAREFVNGAKNLSEMQTEFWKSCGKNVGLERGEKGSKAKHTSIKKYYSEINKYETIDKFKEQKIQEVREQNQKEINRLQDERKSIELEKKHLKRLREDVKIKQSERLRLKQYENDKNKSRNR